MTTERMWAGSSTQRLSGSRMYCIKLRQAREHRKQGTEQAQYMHMRIMHMSQCHHMHIDMASACGEMGK